jgi:signal transduction histidine kinase
MVIVHAVTHSAVTTDSNERSDVALPPTEPPLLRFINVDEVIAESDREGGLVLKIPQLRAVDGEAPTGMTVARRESIELPIPLGDYQALFVAMRSRLFAAFVAVFVVGVVLSTGLASRFTRPIRRLDGAIRRLSEGDLDVEVEAGGSAEIDRLSRAFNEMARRLREGRDRSRALVRREKLSALGRLAAGVAHDVRNPLHSIGLTLQHLTETSRPSEGERAAEFDRALELIRGEIRRLDGLVSNFLRFARSERRERSTVDLADLLRDVVDLVRKEAEWRKIELRLEAASGVPPVEVDAEAMRSSVLNLVLNSFEAMPDGGSLVLRLHAERAEVWLEVADTGRGIPEEDHERVFEFAYTTRDGGSGMGLAMVHHCVVEEHGGRVSLDSRPGMGTRVLVALPVAA